MRWRCDPRHRPRHLGCGASRAVAAGVAEGPDVIRHHTDLIQGSDDEVWRAIDAFPDYAVSSHGRIKRIVQRGTSVAGRLIKQATLYGYRYVNLTRDGSVKACRVHRLACIAFHGAPPSATHHAAHNDGVRDNNFATNLRWATPSENMLDKLAHGTMATGDRNGARAKPDLLARGRRNGKHTRPEKIARGEQHHSAKLSNDDVRAIRCDPRPRRGIAAAYGVSKCAIDGIKTGKTWGHVT